MIIRSTAFENNQVIPDKYGCKGENINPPLSVSEVPSAAVSLVLIVEDPDAPAKIWVHWLLWNIDPQNSLISEGQIPQGSIQGTNDSGKIGWLGPCPPSGTHRYFFKVYALDTTLDLIENSSRMELEECIKGHVIAVSELIGIYSK